MSRYARCIAVPAVLLAALAVAATSSATALPYGEAAGQLQDKREVNKVGDAQLMEEAATRLLGAKVVMSGAKTKPSGGGAVATLGDDRSSSAAGSGSGSGGGEHGKEGEQGSSSNKEGGGDKHPKNNCLSKEACHKKKIICGKECTLSAHSKCAAKCSKSCVPTCG